VSRKQPKWVYAFPRPALTVDMVVFTIRNQDLKVLLIERGGAPFRGGWALPGGFVDVDDGPDQGESVDDAAWRELEEEVGLTRRDAFLEQLYTFGQPGRDPRGRTVTVAYYALVRADVPVRSGSDAADAQWFSVTELPELAFDHDHIVEVALQRIRGKIDYEPRIAHSMVPAEFTQAELRQVHETVKGVKYDRSNFSKRFKRMIEDGKLERAPGKRSTVGRPAQLFRISTAPAPTPTPAPTRR
jgi:8-oxo-dGTP diphosphatase